MLNYYKYKYFLNATHSFDGAGEHRHHHTFTITLHIKEEVKELQLFSSIDELVHGYLRIYERKYLNELPVFLKKIPTIENMGILFFQELGQILLKEQITLMKLEISENPLRVYSVSRELI